MKSVISEMKPAFKPIKVELTLENVEDVARFMAVAAFLTVVSNTAVAATKSRVDLASALRLQYNAECFKEFCNIMCPDSDWDNMEQIVKEYTNDNE